MITLYARKVPASDGTKGQHDVVLSASPDAEPLKARYQWWHSSKPNKRNKFCVLNCYTWRLEWLPDALGV